jgi:hypothetical protein
MVPAAARPKDHSRSGIASERREAGAMEDVGDSSAPGRTAAFPAWRPRLPAVLLLALFAALLFFGRLDCPLLEPEEARYAEIPRQMLAEGHFVVPVLHGLPYYQKPPLLYWLVMGCYAAFGPQDWAARLVPGGAGVLTILLIYSWGRRAIGARAALLGAVILCLTPRFVYLGRMLGTDALLGLEVTAALLAAERAAAGAGLRWRWWLLSAGATGLGLLTKGPVALALLVPPVLALRFVAPGHRLGWRAWLAFLGLALGLAGPWYVTMAWHDPEAARDFFWLHNVQRFVEPFDHVRPFWFYLPDLLGAALPWVIVVFFIRRSRESRGTYPPAPALLALAVAWGIIFLSASGCKRNVYLLPVLPPLALILGHCLDRALGWQPATRLAAAAALPAALVLAGVWWWLPQHHRAGTLRDAAQSAQVPADTDAPVLCYPHAWDSIAFYLRRDVRAFGPGQLGELSALLQSRPETLAFVKADDALATFLKAVPPGREATPAGGAAGRVCVLRLRQAGKWQQPGLREAGLLGGGGTEISSTPCRSGCR